MTTMIVIEGVNPQPWKSPSAGTKRFGGKVVAYTYPNPEVVLYQEAVKEYVADEYPALVPVEPGEHGLLVTFWFWRSLNYGGQRRQRCDTTNLVKATEDALQGLLYTNDKHNRTVTGHIVAQDARVEPLIMVTAMPYVLDPFVDARRVALNVMEGRYVP